MSESINELASKLQPATEAKRPYLPFPPALDRGLIMPKNLSDPLELTEPSGVIIARGFMPAHHDGGLVVLGGEMWAVDHVQVVRIGRKAVELGPSDKGAVSKETGRIVGEGATILSNTEGDVVFGSFPLDLVRNPWAEYYPEVVSVVGNIAIAQPEGPSRFDMKDFDKATGHIVIAEHRRIF